MSLPDQGQEWLQRHIADLTAGRRFPHSGFLELTWRCNFNCVHCYLQDDRHKPLEMKTDSILQILDQVAQAGCLSMSLTGGEPLLRADFPDILSGAVRRGFLVSLFTNASLVDGELAAVIRRNPPRLVEVTLYGASPEAYRQVTGDGDNFASALAGLDRLVADGHEVKLKAMLLGPLLNEAQGMLELAKERNLSIHFDALVDSTLSGRNEPTALRLLPDQAARLLTLDPERRDKLLEFCAQPREWGLSAEQRGCGAGLTTFNIDPAGRLSPCLLLRQPSIDTLEHGFSHAWQKLGEYPWVQFDQDSPCLDCELEHLCSHCPGHERLGEKPPPDRDFFACKVSKRLQSMLGCTNDGGRNQS